MVLPKNPPTDTAADSPPPKPPLPPIFDISTPPDPSELFNKPVTITSPAPPPPKVQPQTTPTPADQTIPVVTTKQFVQPKTQAAPKNNITAENAPALQNWLNDLKGYVYDSFAKEGSSVHRAAAYSHSFTANLLGSLALYRGGLAKFYFDEGVYEMIFSALGPLGNLMSQGREGSIRRKMAWMKNPLNPNAIYYYLNSLPAQAAFKVLYLPAKATFGILARGGAPLISRVTYTNHQTGTVQQDFVFSPLLRATQFSQKLADGLDRFSGNVSDDFRQHGEEKSPWEKHVNKKNDEFKKALISLQQARKSGDKKLIKQARFDLKNLLNQQDGNFFKAIFGRGLNNTARRLRHTNRDPISFLLTLVGGAIWDLTAGLALNVLRVTATKIINTIPGLNALRAQAIEFFSSNRYMTTARIGGASIQSFVKGVFSPTTLSSGYLGYRFGSLLTPNLYFNLYGIPINVGGAIATPIFAGTGAFYNTGLKMAANPTIIEWVYKYDELLAKATDPYLSVAQQNFYRGELEKNFLNIDSRIANFRPGPLSNFAKWLYDHPFARLPINGFVVGDLLSPLMQARYGWNPWLTRGVFAGADYLWQTKGAWGNLLNKQILQPIIKILTQPTWTIFGREFINHFSIQNPNALAFKIRGFFGRAFYVGDAYSNALLERPWLNSLKNLWSKTQPYLKNFFNPGFFLGIQFLGPIFMGMGLPFYFAYPLGALAGAGAWWGAHAIYSAIAGKSAMTLGRWTSLGWTGYFVGWITQGLLGLLGIHGAWMQFLPLIGSLSFPLISLIPSLGGLFSGLAIMAENAIFILAHGLGISAFAVAGAMATFATIASVAMVAGLTIFSVFVIYSAFWVPMMGEWHAGPTSTNFSINTNCHQLSDNNYQCCAKFDVTQDVFNINNFLRLTMDFEDSQLTVDLIDPPKTTSALRNTTALNYVFDWDNLTPANFGLALPPPEEPQIVGGSQTMMSLQTNLSTPSDQKSSLYNLLPNNPNLVNSIIPFLDMLQKLSQDKINNTNYYLEELAATKTILKNQTTLLENISNNFKSASQNNDLTQIIAKLTNIQTNLNDDLTKKPLEEPKNTCAVDDQRCQTHFQEMQGIYNSWNSPLNQLLSGVSNLLTTAQNLNPTDQNYQQQFSNFQVNLSDAQSSAATLFSNSEQQTSMLTQIYNKLNGLMTGAPPNLSKDDANYLISVNINNFSNLADADKQKLWGMLTAYFPDIFTNSQYYYIPQGTNYTFCADTVYCHNDPAMCAPTQPQTVCSTIEAQTNIWNSSAWAKHCVTFTPTLSSP
ncbi:MAG: hypothetical protein NTZ93_04205 [Candidatus Beckwithbacteria bacterium]|nr:hypothetical protein [Candidatus Beckwithbacteria bacterium]